MTERTCPAADLARALKACAPGDTLTVDGDITRAKITGVVFPDPGVRLVGRFIGYNLFTGCAGLTFAGEVVESAGTSALTLKQGERLAVAGMKITGAVKTDAGLWKGGGLIISDVAGYRVEDVDAFDLGGAISISRGSGVLRRIKLHDIAEDGLHLFETSDILIEDVEAWDFQGQGHPDVVQVFDAADSAPMRNLTIRRVTYRRGQGGAAQGVFLKAAHPMEGVLIEQCGLIGPMYNAVHVDNAVDPVLRGNFAQGIDMDARVMLRNCVGGTLDGNTANGVFALSSSGVTETGNQIIPLAPDADESRLSAFLASLSGPVAAAPAPAEDPRVAELTAQVGDLTVKLQAATDAAKAQAVALQGELDDARAALAAAQARIAAARAEIAAAQASLAG